MTGLRDYTISLGPSMMPLWPKDAELASRDESKSGTRNRSPEASPWETLLHETQRVVLQLIPERCSSEDEGNATQHIAGTRVEVSWTRVYH